MRLSKEQQERAAKASKLAGDAMQKLRRDTLDAKGAFQLATQEAELLEQILKDADTAFANAATTIRYDDDARHAGAGR